MAPRLVVLFLLLTSLAATIEAQPIVRVPADATFADALDQVADGGVIEVADGVYEAPLDGFLIDSAGRSFTVRAAAGASPVLAAGEDEILRVQATAEPLAFERLTFRGGRSDSVAFAGGVTVRDATVTFRDCVFEDNAATASTGGGALRVDSGASVTVEGGRFADNRASSRGGAIELFQAELVLRDVVFENNRTLDDGLGEDVGGALYALDAEVLIERSTFRGNRARFAGGAIFAFGSWLDDLSPDPETPGAESLTLTVTDSWFVDNALDGDPGFGGAIHLEDQAILRVERTRFESNQALLGGAIDSYRAVVEIVDGAFVDNLAGLGSGPSGADGGTGGALFAASNEVADRSNDEGAINRRADSITVEGTLFRGNRATSNGGCFFVGGDLNAQNGLGGMERDADLAFNRTSLRLVDSVLFDCRGLAAGASGGGLFTSFAALEIEGSILAQNRSGPGASGGLLLDLDGSRLAVAESWIVGNQADDEGGAILASAAELLVDGSVFVANRVGAGDAEPLARSQGAALFTLPVLGRRAQGRVADSLFVDSEGLPIAEGDRAAGPANATRYDGNRFRETTYGGRVYRNPLDTSAGRTPEQIDDVVIRRADGSASDKGSVENVSLDAAPSLGRLLVAGAGAGVEAPGGDALPLATLGWAWTGTRGVLDGPGGRLVLPARSGVRAVGAPGLRRLEVDDEVVDQVEVVALGPCALDDTLLCLDGERFEVTVRWRDFDGNEGGGRVVPFGTEASGLFYFFDAENWELLVKVLDGCGLTQHYWVFAAATTNVEYQLTVTDRLASTASDEVSVTYANPLGVAAPAITDTFALATCGAMRAPSSRVSPPRAGSSAVASKAAVASREIASKGGACAPSATRLCLRDGRFAVTVEWRDFDGGEGDGLVAQGAPSDDSGLFTFFDASNFELLVKVLDGCGLNQRHWVFAAATTNVGYTLRVEDTATGEVALYDNPLGVSSDAVTDTNALGGCP